MEDRKMPPNFAKHFLSLGSFVVTPPLTIIGIRGYSKDRYGLDSLFDVYAKDLPKELSRLFKTRYEEKEFVKAEKLLGQIEDLFAIAAVMPNRAGLEQKKPYVFEVA